MNDKAENGNKQRGESFDKSANHNSGMNAAAKDSGGGGGDDVKQPASGKGRPKKMKGPRKNIQFYD